MLFYFTATGNCLYVAKKFEENPISIPQVLHQENLEFKDETIGIVAPIYAGELPHIVREFIEKAKFETDYFYMLLTYGMNDSVAGEWSEQFAKSHGIHVDYIRTIQMVDNYLSGFDMNEQMAMDKHIPEQIKVIQEDIAKRQSFIPVPTKDGREKYALVKKRFEEHPELNNGEKLVMTQKCMGCGICTKVCPRGIIRLEKGQAVRVQKTCEFCMACIHSCPHKAIIIQGEVNKEARYRNEYITLQEIIRSNQQQSVFINDKQKEL